VVRVSFELMHTQSAEKYASSLDWAHVLNWYYFWW
jgi:hypothetical protein